MSFKFHHGSGKEKEKQLSKTTVIWQLVFLTESCKKRTNRVSFQILYPTIN